MLSEANMGTFCAPQRTSEPSCLFQDFNQDFNGKQMELTECHVV